MVGRRQIGHRLLAIRLDERRQVGGHIPIQDHALQPGVGDGVAGHAVGSLLSMFRASINPTVPPLTGRSRPSARNSVRGMKIADISHKGGSLIRSTVYSSGTTM